MSITPYSLNHRSPPAVNEAVAKSMRGNKAKDTKPELTLRKALRNHGLSGYRLHWKKAPGRPDVCYPGRRLAIFVHGCYWHRCPHCKLGLPKRNQEFWKEKFERNRNRDERKEKNLRSEGWRVLVLWECQIKSDIEGCLKRVKEQWSK